MKSHSNFALGVTLVIAAILVFGALAARAINNHFDFGHKGEIWCVTQRNPLDNKINCVVIDRSTNRYISWYELTPRYEYKTEHKIFFPFVYSNIEPDSLPPNLALYIKP